MANHRPVSGWAIGWISFAATVLIMLAVFQGIAGLSAVLDDEVFVLSEVYVFKLDLTTWGWVHLGIALVLLLAGVGLFKGAVWARTIGVLVAVVSAVLNFAYLPWYPIWSIIMIVVCFSVIWALTVHGRDLATESEPVSTYEVS